MFPIRLLAAAVVAALATGCAVGPDYRRPDAPLPDHYLGQAPGPHGAATVQAAWWDGFGDPQLTHYVALALDQNLDLAQAAGRMLPFAEPMMAVFVGAAAALIAAITFQRIRG